MGNTSAWPVLRTADLSQALDLARRLLSVASRYDPTWCYLEAWARTDADLKRWASAFPRARTDSHGPEGSGLPVNVSLNLASVEEAAQALRTGMSIGRCHVLWHNVHWPAVAELDLGEEHKYAELQIACNSRDIYCEEPADGHTVFVHSRPGDQRRVEWLAAQTGAAVVGPPELG